MEDFPAKPQIYRHSLISVIRFVVLLWCVVCGGGSLTAQNPQPIPARIQRQFNDAREQYQRYNLEGAVENLEKILSKFPDYAEAWLLLGYCKQDIDQPQEAISAFSQAIQINPTGYPELYLTLADLNYNLGLYDQAQVQLETYEELFPEVVKNGPDLRYKRLRASIEFSIHAMEHPWAKEPVQIMASNSEEFAAYFPSLTGDGRQLVWTREKYDPLTNRRQEDLFTGQLLGSLLSQVEPLELNVPPGVNEGTQTLRQDGRLMIFTGCNYPDSKGGCDLYFTKKVGGVWGPVFNLNYPVNSRYWESTPALSPDASMLVFSSNRPGGIGGMDLWYSIWNDTTGWSDPLNPGSVINTPGDEMAPFFYADGQTLFYSSDSLIGLGKLDIFEVHLSGPDRWSAPMNRGYPLNTHANDFGIALPVSGEFAVFSSDRDSSGLKKLYRLQLPNNQRPQKLLVQKGNVRDSLSGKPVQASVTIRSLSGDLLQLVDSDPVSGEFMISIPERDSVLLSAEAENYFYFSRLESLERSGGDELDHRVVIGMKPISFSERLVLDHLYFDTDSFSLRPNSEAELQLIVGMMKVNPRISIVIEGYTDSSGTKIYNQELSQKRANAIKEALIRRGIDASRILATGMGDANPRGDNQTEEGRALNRRTEMRIREVN